MRQRYRKPKHAIRSIGTLFVLLFTLILPLIGSAKGVGPLVCADAKRTAKHDCAHCSLIATQPSMVEKLTEETSEVTDKVVTEAKDSCCQLEKTRSQNSKPRAKEFSKSAPVCECEMAPANTRPTSNGSLAAGFSSEPLNLAQGAPSLDDSGEPLPSQTISKIRRGPPDAVFRLGPPDRAPPAR